jgi:hypothetical protein
MATDLAIITAIVTTIIMRQENQMPSVIAMAQRERPKKWRNANPVGCANFSKLLAVWLSQLISGVK